MNLRIQNKRTGVVEAHKKVNNIRQAKQFVESFGRFRCDYYLNGFKFNVRKPKVYKNQMY